MQALLLSADLMLSSAAHGAAQRHGVNLSIAGNADQAIALCNAQSALFAIDLRLPGLDVTSLAPQLRQSAAPGVAIVAFGPHVHTEALSAAAAAGCDEVFTRGQFEHRFDALLAALTAPAARDQK